MTDFVQWKPFDMLPNAWKSEKNVLQVFMSIYVCMLIKFNGLMPVFTAVVVLKNASNEVKLGS